MDSIKLLNFQSQLLILHNFGTDCEKSFYTMLPQYSVSSSELEHCVGLANTALDITLLDIQFSLGFRCQTRKAAHLSVLIERCDEQVSW